MFIVVEQALGELIQPFFAPTVWEADTRRIIHTKAVVDMIGMSVNSDTGFIVPISKTVGKMTNRAVDESTDGTWQKHLQQSLTTPH